MAKVRQRKSWTHDRFTDDFGQLWHVHKRIVCTGTNCAIHNPSDHHMKDWPMLVRASTLIERMCEHACGHPDPDSVAFFKAIGKDWLASHGCDLCCFGLEAIGEIKEHQAWVPPLSITEKNSLKI